MAQICLIACVNAKSKTSAPAQYLYQSPLFKKSREYARLQSDRWFILSAKYGLVDPDEIIAPYDKTLSQLSVSERKRWADLVLDQLLQVLKPLDEIVFLAGIRYREYLIPTIKRMGCRVTIPLEGLSIGKQLQHLNSFVGGDQRNSHVDRFYGLLQDLEHSVGGQRHIGASTGSMCWPKRGLYLFFESGECRRQQPIPRVVRVGTHGVSRGSSSTLWTRLRTHRGSVDGSGNHRSSIFRLHAGAAMCARSHRSMPSWGEGQSASPEDRVAEAELEREVSEYIGHMSVLWLAVEDEPSPSSDRAYLERNIVGLLVGPRGPLDPPSAHWLGRHSPHQAIRESGLWNLDFLSYRYDPRFLDVLEEYNRITAGAGPSPAHPLAPTSWHRDEVDGVPRSQLNLFEE